MPGEQDISVYVSNIEIGRPDFIGGGAWQLEQLSGITILFGKNGSGKSMLLRAWRDQDPPSIHYVVPERTGEIGYAPNLLEQQIDPIKRGKQSRRNFSENYRQQVVTRIQIYFSARGDAREGQLPGNPEELEQFLTRLLPDFMVGLSGTKNPPYILTRASDEVVVQNIDQLSSGEAQLTTMALDALTVAAIWDIQNHENRILLIDEPDAHIHPDLQVRFADFLVAIARRYKLQVVVATHSTALLASLGQFAEADASVIYLDRAKDRFPAAPFTTETKELAACLGGHALMGPLFSVPLLLVEGDDDYRIWSQVPRYHVTSFSVIPSNGDEIKKYQKSLEVLFSSLRTEDSGLSGYALIDSDKGKPEPGTNNPQKHVRFIQLSCHESENLFLADETLALFELYWTAAVRKINDEAHKYGEKENQLRAVAAGDRKTIDAKAVIEQLSLILDPKRVHWTLRVSQAIGRSRPEGQIADFLGEEVLDALWPAA